MAFKAMFFGGVYDTWVPGGDVRLITNPFLDPVHSSRPVPLRRRRLDHR